MLVCNVCNIKDRIMIFFLNKQNRIMIITTTIGIIIITIGTNENLYISISV